MLSDKPLELRVYEKEIRMRKKVSRMYGHGVGATTVVYACMPYASLDDGVVLVLLSDSFNKPASAFDSIKEYNDYLEMVEVYSA